MAQEAQTFAIKVFYCRIFKLYLEKQGIKQWMFHVEQF